MPPRPVSLPWRRLLAAALAAVAIFFYWTHANERADRRTGHEGVRETESRGHESDTPTKSWGTSVGFADQRRLEEHYGKHGAEFGNITRQDYLHQAQLLRDADVGGPVLQTVRADGVTTRFDRQTGAFIAFNRNGTIRTFFKPNDGERYFRRQADRVGE
jgi:pyocin large subunit-like protein